VTYYGLLLFFFFEYVRPGTYVPALNILRLNTIIPVAVVVGAAFSGGRVTHRQAFGELNFWLVLALLGLIGVSVLTADVTLYAFTVYTMVAGYVAITWAMCKQLTETRQVRGVLMALVFVHLVVAALTPEMITNPEVRHYVASGSFLGDGNDFALSVNLVIPFCLFFFLEAKGLARRAFYLAALFFLAFCVVATQSRGGTVGLACVGLYYWLKSDRKIGMAVVGVLVATMVFLYAPDTYFDRMNQINTTEGSARGRILAWEASMRMAADHPILGIGAGHFGVKYGVDYRPPTGERVPWQTAHSIYFLALGELGFPGLLLLVSLILSNMSANRRLAKAVRMRNDPTAIHDVRLLACLSASLIAFAVNGAFLSALYYPHVYVLAGLNAACRRLVRERHAGTPQGGVQADVNEMARALDARLER